MQYITLILIISSAKLMTLTDKIEIDDNFQSVIIIIWNAFMKYFRLQYRFYRFINNLMPKLICIMISLHTILALQVVYEVMWALLTLISHLQSHQGLSIILHFWNMLLFLLKLSNSSLHSRFLYSARLRHTYSYLDDILRISLKSWPHGWSICWLLCAKAEFSVTYLIQFR